MATITDKPTNAIVHLAADSTTFEATNYTNKEAPSSTLLQYGYKYKQVISCENFNYTMDNLALWMEYCETRIDELQALVEQERLPVGSIFENGSDSTNPADLFGYGTWESYGEGQTLVGVGTFEDTNGDEIVWALGDTAGEYYHTLTTAQTPTHTHTYSGTTSSAGAHEHDIYVVTQSVTNDADSGDEAPMFGSDQQVSAGFNSSYEYAASAGAHTHTYSGTTSSVGSGNSFNVMQPTKAVYRWIRTE